MNEPLQGDGAGSEWALASLGRRTLAALIDNSVWLLFYGLFLGGVVAAVADSSSEAAGLLVFAYLSLWFNYFAFCEWRWGQTIGKNAMGIMVVPVEGGPVTFGQSSMRNLLRLIDWLLIGWVMIASGSRKQRLGDLAAKTLVVRRPRGTGTTMKRSADLAATPIAGAAGDSAATGPEVPADSAAAAAPPAPAQRADGGPGPDPSRLERGAEARPGLRGRLPAITWSIKDTVWGLIAGMILAILAPVLVLPFDPGFDSDAAMLAAQALFGLSLLVVPIGIASGWNREELRLAPERLGLRPFRFSALGWMLLVLFLFYLFAALFSALVLEPKQDDVSSELGVGDENLLVAVAAVVLIVGLAPLAEELFFRGFVFSGLRSRFTLWPAALISGLIFGGVHATTGVTTVIPLAALGVALAWLYNKTGSLWPAVIAHLINNAIALALLEADGGAVGGWLF